MYHNQTTNKWEWIKWDANECFGSYSGGPGGPNMTTLPLNFTVNNRPLLQNIFSSSVLYNQYLQEVCYVSNNLFNTTELDFIIDNFKSLRRIVANFINILKGKGIAFQGLEPELDRVLATLKDLETMDLDSVDIGIYEDKYFDMFENIVVKSNEMKKNPLIPENDPEYQVLLDRIKEID